MLRRRSGEEPRANELVLVVAWDNKGCVLGNEVCVGRWEGMRKVKACLQGGRL